MFGFGFRSAFVTPSAAVRQDEYLEDEYPDICNEPELYPAACEWTDFAADEVVLVSKEDIYAREGRQMVLLLKKGREITVEQLPKFIKNGVNPTQFWLRRIEPIEPAQGRRNTSYETDPMRQAPMTPITRTSRAVRKHQSVLILDTDAKSLRRTMDCLFRCGFTLSRIHPVRMPAHLGWALQKYQPDVLVIDYHLEGGHSALGLMQELGELPNPPEHVFLTLSLPEAASGEEQRMIQEAAARFDIRVLLKPLSRYTVHSVLEQQGL